MPARKVSRKAAELTNMSMVQPPSRPALGAVRLTTPSPPKKSDPSDTEILEAQTALAKLLKEETGFSKDELRRHFALQLAIESLDVTDGYQAEYIISYARQFEAYLKGGE